MKLQKTKFTRLLAAVCLLVSSVSSAVFAADSTVSAKSDESLAAIGADEVLATRAARQEALFHLQTLAKQRQGAGKPEAAARAYNRLGEIYLKVNDPQASLAAHQEALRLAKEAGVLPLQADSLNGLSFTYLQQHELEKAKSTLDDALKISQETGYKYGLARAYNHLSLFYVQQKPLSEAVSTAQKAITLWQELQDQRGEAQARYRLGEAYLVLSRNAESLSELETSVSLWRTVGNNAEQATTLLEIAFLWMRQAEWDKAFEYCNQAKPLVDAEAEPYIAGQLASAIGDVYFTYNLPDLAQESYKESLNFFRQAKSPDGIAAQSLTLARAKFFAGDTPAAITSLREALRFSEEINSPIITALAHEYLGEVYLAWPDNNQALTELNAAFKIYEGFPRPREMARARTFMGQAELAQGRLDEAFLHYSKALEGYQSFHNYTSEAALYHGLGQVEMKRGNMAEAGRLFKLSLELTEKLRAAGTSQDLRTAFLAKVYPRYESYIDWLMQMRRKQPQQGFEEEALTVSERARARALLETLQESRVALEAQLTPELAAQKRELEQKLKQKENEQTGLLINRQSTDKVAGELRELEEQYRRAKDEIAARNPRYAQLTQAPTLTAQEIKQLAPDNQTAFLEYSLGENNSYLWVVTQDGLTSYTLPPRARIAAAAAALHNLLIRPDIGGADRPRKLRQAAQDLGFMVLRPAAAALKPRLVVVGDGVLSSIPFQTLSLEDSGEPLIERYEIANAPSFTTLAQLQTASTKRSAAAKTIAAFGDPVFRADFAQRSQPAAPTQLAAALPALRGEQLAGALRDVDDTINPADLPSLSFSRQEINDITAPLSSSSQLKALNFDATRETLRQTDLRQFRILHLSTHGLLNNKRPENSGIVFSMVDRQGRDVDGFLRLPDVYALDAPVDLVVLSACRTALGKDVRGEGLMSLTRGFMYAGASSVASSLWKVDDEATAKLMGEFYQNLLNKGLPPATALRRAQNHLRGQKAWQDPYYWAAFTLHGQYNRPITPLSNSYLWLFAILPLPGATALIYYLLRRRRLRRNGAECA
jgi:CHAT domain-containing protein